MKHFHNVEVSDLWIYCGRHDDWLYKDWVSLGLLCYIIVKCEHVNLSILFIVGRANDPVLKGKSVSRNFLVGLPEITLKTDGVRGPPPTPLHLL